MLPRNRRIPSPLLLPALKQSSVRFSDHLKLNIHYLAEEKKNEPARVAIIVSAKVNPRAVDRHRSKRLISAYFEKELKLTKPGQFIIVQVKKDITKLTPAALAKEIKSLF